ncbi:hypothetical protein QTO05_15710 [Vibrio fortis]|uniref:hypothetical protein n=1 Tax=Vibrio fortis TaxID=212667 RepID=UPI002F3F663E
MKNNIVIPLFILLMSGCASQKETHWADMSSNVGLNEETLRVQCEKIECSYDNLKGSVIAVAEAEENFDPLSLFSDTRKVPITVMEYRWESGTNKVRVGTSVITKQSELFKRAEIYVGREMVAELSEPLLREISYIDKKFREEYKDTIVGDISIDVAKVIADAPSEAVTVRFYSQSKTSDVKLPPTHNLASLVSLAESDVSQ